MKTGRKGKTIEPNRLVIGTRDKNKVAAIFAEIETHEKSAKKILVKTALAYYEAGNILVAALKKSYVNAMPNLKDISAAVGFPTRHVSLALRIFKRFENNPDLLKELELRDALKLIAPTPPAGEDGYNRVDLGGDPGQPELDFGELFNLPPAANKSLKNYRTVGELVSEIIVVRRTEDNLLTSKRFARFFEDIPQNPALRSAFMAMSKKTQAAIEDYLAALEQEENR